MLHEYIKLIARAIYTDIPTLSHAVSLVSDPRLIFFQLCMMLKCPTAVF